MSYTQSNAFLGSLATLSYCATSTGTYTAFAEIKSITTAKTSVGKVKVTNLQSPNFAHEYKPGFIEPGSYEFDANMTDADNVEARSLLRLPYFFKIVFNNAVSTAGTTRKFSGWVAEVGEKVDPDKEVTHSIKLDVTGTEAVTAAS